ncbi:glycoside hydrolase family 130 protein [Larkinella humicola]|uniref:Glycosidase n=1 Tax=Larkinella humicola TaxID=2607654 RepID=A0A5N1JRH8_9BACT|nr:glycoside hydrolase family 130 protein [Larkinella humicola]KAA9356433.1 glycosidase [Larkinella humicola]
MVYRSFLSLVVLVFHVASYAQSPYKPWMIGEFTKQHAANPVLDAQKNTTFDCPLRGETVHWEEKDVFNPAVVVRKGKICMIYRAEDTVGKHAGTSRLGLAVSTDGIHFKRRPKPVFYPDNDPMKVYEWEGGCEDPRIVESPNRVYIMTYTAYDGDKARLCVATSRNLINWKKQGLAFDDLKYRNEWSKSGSIVCKRIGSRLVAEKINGKYWMYWGDQPQLYCASSPDLIHWTPVETTNGKLFAVAERRKDKHDYRLLEPGPPALITPSGIVLLYNGMNHGKDGDRDLPDGTYAAGQLLFDASEPTKLIDRSETYFLKPDQPYEMVGQINHVCFIEGLVPYKGQWFLYYGTADSKIAVATAPEKP